MNPVQVEFGYEQAESETELARKSAQRKAEGWIASAQPCVIRRHNLRDGDVTSLSQAFHRLIFADDSGLQGIMRTFGREAVA